MEGEEFIMEPQKLCPGILTSFPYKLLSFPPLPPKKKKKKKTPTTWEEREQQIDLQSWPHYCSYIALLSKILQ